MGVKRWEDISLPGSAMRRQIGLDTTDHKIVTRVRQDNIQEILDQNQRMRNDHTDGQFNRNGPDGWTMVAQIPLWLLEKWRVEEGIDYYRWNEDDKARIMRKLNDTEYLALRTSKGKI